MLFSFNHPLGACGKCQGFGLEPQLDKNKMIPDLKSSVSDFGVAPWNFGKHRRYYTQARQSAKLRGFDIATPFASYDDDDWRWLFSGDGKKFKGIEGYFAYLDRKKYKVHYRIHGARFKNYVRCASCQGHRLNPLALACRIDDRNIGQLMDLSLDLLNSWVAKIIDRKNTEKKIVTNRDLAGAEDALLELKTRLAYLNKIGLSYLNLNRTVRSLSGGEFQRINMTRCLGSALVDTLYCLDEPTCGLHPKDTASLISVIAELKSQGNTVVIVEHDKSVIKAADYLVEIGPGAGHLGGNLTFKGDPKTHVIGRSLRDAGSATLVTPSGSSVEHHTDCTKLKAALALGVPNGEQALARISPLKGEAAEITEGEPTEFFSIESVSTNNLKNVSCRFPVAALTVVCGVSGSGKTSLIQHTLLPRLQSLLGQPVDEHLDVQSRGGTLRHESLIKYHESAELVSQGAIGRSSRSNIATYLDLMTEIRKIFAKQNDAKAMGLKAGDFSFNTPGGRCEECCGMGTVVEDLSFLGEMEVICQSCEGKRFTDNVLKIDVQGKNLTDVLGMTVAEARQFFFENKKIRETADATMDIGLDYLTLGQHTSSFSGGEAQRLKLLGTLRKLRDGHRKILIFDEPSSGLSDKDIALLLGIFRKLVSEHHTVIVIEHHLDVIKACDWVVEVGPMAAEKGGEIIFQGPLQSFRQQSSSPTAPYL
jgi:excinuclease ABC subunit A